MAASDRDFFVEFFNYFLHPSRVLLSCQNVSQDTGYIVERMLMSSCALRCYCIQGQHVSAILCTNHPRSHADENILAPSTYHQISKGVDGDG